MKKILILLTVCSVAWSCQKRKYPDTQVTLEKEDIYFSGSVDNTPLSLKIGTDGYYCYSSYTQNAGNIYVFAGELKKYNCNPCPLSLKLELSDYRPRPAGASVPPDSALRTGSRHFIPALSQATTIKFVSHSNKAVSSWRWDCNGSSSGDSATSFEFAQPGAQTVSLTVLTKGGCESVVVNKIYVDAVNGLFACNVSANTGQGNSSQFRAGVIGGTPPFRYSWNFGDASTSSQAAPGHTYQWAGSYPVKLQITDAENRVCECNYIQVVGNDISSCAANMSLSYVSSRNSFLDGVRLQWTDASNTVLRSDSVAQPAGSYFEVLSSQPFEPNDHGDNGRLLKLRFNVLLGNGSRKVWFKSDSTTMAVSYK